jgi:RHS repeat-associated protein
VVQDYQYDSFGNLKDQKNRIKQPYTFTGREWDKEIGLYYYRARYYDAEVGRFISFDPILHPANGQSTYYSCGQVQNIFIPSFWSLKENPQNLNPYVYVGNNPVNYTDPTGLGPPSECSAYTLCCLTGDLYACSAQVICVSAGDSPTSNCLRNCLVDLYDCGQSLVETAIEHAYCYPKCLCP